jgi:hypothetical protein
MDVLEIPDPGACISRSEVTLSFSVLESETPDIDSANFCHGSDKDAKGWVVTREAGCMGVQDTVS